VSVVAGTLARYYAKQAVKAQLRREKIKITEIAPREINARTEAYLAEHAAELLAKAEQTIAASPVLQKMVARQSVRNDQRNRTLTLRRSQQVQAIQR
jgi:hypothetical protein